MGEILSFKLIDHGFADPRTGKKLESIEGRYNRPDIDPFVHLGREYPEIDQRKIIDSVRKEKTWYVEMGLTSSEAVQIVDDEDPKFSAKHLLGDEVEYVREMFFKYPVP